MNYNILPSTKKLIKSFFYNPVFEGTMKDILHKQFRNEIEIYTFFECKITELSRARHERLQQLCETDEAKVMQYIRCYIGTKNKEYGSEDTELQLTNRDYACISLELENVKKYYATCTFLNQ